MTPHTASPDMGRTCDSASSLIVIVELAIVGLVIGSLRLGVVGHTSNLTGNMMTASYAAASDATRTA